MSYLKTIMCFQAEIQCLKDKLAALETMMLAIPIEAEFPTVAVINGKHVLRIVTQKKSEDIVLPVFANKNYAIVGRLKIAAKPTKGLQVAFSIPTGATFLVNVLGANGNGEVTASMIDGEENTMDVIIQDGVVDFRGFLSTLDEGGNLVLQIKTMIGDRLISIREGSEIRITEL